MRNEYLLIFDLENIEKAFRKLAIRFQTGNYSGQVAEVNIDFQRRIWNWTYEKCHAMTWNITSLQRGYSGISRRHTRHHCINWEAWVFWSVTWLCIWCIVEWSTFETHTLLCRLLWKGLPILDATAKMVCLGSAGVGKIVFPNYWSFDWCCADV